MFLRHRHAALAAGETGTKAVVLFLASRLPSKDGTEIAAHEAWCAQLASPSLSWQSLCMPQLSSCALWAGPSQQRVPGPGQCTGSACQSSVPACASAWRHPAPDLGVPAGTGGTGRSACAPAQSTSTGSGCATSSWPMPGPCWQQQHTSTLRLSARQQSGLSWTQSAASCTPSWMRCTSSGTLNRPP